MENILALCFSELIAQQYQLTFVRYFVIFSNSAKDFWPFHFTRIEKFDE